MPCYFPLQAYIDKHRKTFKGKKVIVFKKERNRIPLAYEEIQLPCGNCIGCRIKRTGFWAMRCMHESSLYENNCFITLTYDDKYIPKYNSLKVRDFQLFMKKLRGALIDYNTDKYRIISDSSKKVKYYCCGEYGDRRPEFNIMSKGIGKEWYNKYKHDVYPRDYVVIKGKKVMPPKYYDNNYEIEYPDDFKKIKELRKERCLKNQEHNTEERLAVRHEVQ